jgi:glutamate carboxypeptidase
LNPADFLARAEPEAIRVLKDLVAVNSFTHNREGVNKVGDMCVALFEPLGFRAHRERSPIEDCGDHVFLARPGDPGVNKLVLVSHLDTVYPENNFTWREEGDRIYGPGVCDIKGGTIVLWLALRAMRAAEPALFDATSWTVMLNASEEGGCPDFPGLARERAAGARACLVYEAGFDADDGASTVVVSRKGAARFHVHVTGHEAHSGNAHAAGASAIREMCGLVERIEALTDYGKDITLNVGHIEGGSFVNCVPGSSTCHVDLRIATPEAYAWGRETLLGLAGPGRIRSADGEHRCDVTVAEVPGYPPWPPNDESDRLGALAVEVGRGLGQPLVISRRKGASDGSNVWDVAPTIDGLGPIGRSTHIVGKENVDRASFVPRAHLSVELFKRLLA